MKKYLLMLAACCLAFAACEKENGNGNGNGPEENPEPTQITSFYVGQTGIAVDPDGFNMLTDGGFENFIGDEDWKSKSLSYLPEYVSESEVPLTGERSIYADCNTDGWRDIAVQSVCLKKNKSYTLSLWYQGAWKGLNVYMGFRGAAGHDTNTNNKEGNDSWAEYSYTYENIDDVKADAFIGGWCYWDLWVEVDDMKVIPTGSMNDSFMPTGASITSQTITNVSFNEVKSAEKIVAWKEADGTLSGVLSNAEVGKSQLHNVFFTTKKYDKAAGPEVLTVATESMTASALIPTAGITVNGTKYVNFYEYAGLTSPGEGDDAETFVPDWTASKSVVYSSVDGNTWTETSLTWPADSRFIKAAYLQKGDYVYMFGSPAGDGARLTYLARVKAADFANLSSYEYWAGEEWVSGDETLAAGIMYGPTDCMSVVYNADRYTYMMIYRSSTTGGLVYRDAGLPEGEWSGEKILLTDSADAALYAPQVLSVSNNDITFVASKMQ
ncbi:MAG: DUF4185 domain-containing protein [Bacteroidales bacterium]|nr:DUF4185 domain-containing protein [Bacteroidales bacterium]